MKDLRLVRKSENEPVAKGNNAVKDTKRACVNSVAACKIGK